MTQDKKILMTNGTALNRDGLTILVKYRDPYQAKDLIDRLMSDHDPDDGPVGPERVAACELEIGRLQDLMERIVRDYPDKLDIFQYVPLTKSGHFNNAQNTLVADSNCTTAALYDGGRGRYLDKRSVQIRLMPYYHTTNGFICGQPVENMRELRLDLYDSSRKTTPIFDHDGVPSKPAATRASYIRDQDLKPGYVYEEKSGTQFLVLSGMQFGVRYIFQYAGFKPCRTAMIWYGKDNHVYVRWTKKLAEALGGCQDFNTLCHIMADKAKNQPWPFGAGVSVRENPRKFVRIAREAGRNGQVLSEGLTRDEIFQTEPHETPMAGGRVAGISYEYFLFEDDRIPDRFLSDPAYNRDEDYVRIE